MTDSKKLEQATDAELERRVRELLLEMAPLEQALARLRVEIQQVATEQRRRERSRHLSARMQVRTTVAAGQLPSLQQIAASSNELVPSDQKLTAFRFFRDSGTEVGLGYATAREPTIWMTDGPTTIAVKTIEEIRARYADGWEFGTAAHAGVRIHIPNTRTEKLLTASEVFVKLRDP